MKISTKEIVFENVRYGDTQVINLEIENVGDGLLEFEIGRTEEKTGAQKNVNWL